MPGVVAVELLCSRSVRSSLEVALEQVSRPLSVVEGGPEMEEPTLSEADRLGSMNGTPPAGTEPSGIFHTGRQFKDGWELTQC